MLTAVPRLGLGTAVFRDGNHDGTLANVVTRAIKQGVRLFDTAQNYGSEQGIAEGLRDAQIPRGQIWISGKVDLNSTEDPAVRMKRQLESSLGHLGSDYMDSLCIHWPVCLDDPNADHAYVRRASDICLMLTLNSI